MKKEQFDRLLTAMLNAGGPGIADLLFIPGRPPQMDCFRKLRPFEGSLTDPVVTEELTGKIAALLIVMSENGA